MVGAISENCIIVFVIPGIYLLEHGDDHQEHENEYGSGNTQCYCRITQCIDYHTPLFLFPGVVS